MLEHHQAMRAAQQPDARASGRRIVNVATQAARAQASGFAQLNELARSLSAESLDAESVRHDSGQCENHTLAPNSTLSSAEREALDTAAVEEELERWLASGLITNTREVEEFDLVRFWQVSLFVGLPLHHSLIASLGKEVRVPYSLPPGPRCTSCTGLRRALRAGFLGRQGD